MWLPVWSSYAALPGEALMDVPREVADAAGMPDDLDSGDVGPYLVPSPTRRKLAGRVYVVGAGIAIIGAVTVLPAGYWFVALAFLAIAGYHWVSAWELPIRDVDALEVANRQTPFPVGHAAAQVGFAGWRARPVWNILVFSADDPPTQRGLVRVDGVSGAPLESYVEEIRTP